jgi:hypothetical protein
MKMHMFVSKEVGLFSISLLLISLIMPPNFLYSQTEAEPNDQWEQANEIRLDETIEGFFQKRNDSDWYKLVVTQPGKSIIQIELSAVSGTDSFVEIYNEENDFLVRADRGEEGEPEKLTDIGVIEGTYYIYVYGSEKNETDPYKLSIRSIRSWQEGYEFEINNEIEYANTMQLDKPIKGKFQAFNDEDWYKLAVTESGKNILRIELSAVPEVRSALGIYDAEGDSLKQTDINPEGQPEVIVNLGVTEGTYYIRAIESGGTKNETDFYSLTARLSGPWKEGQEFEVNDDREQANHLKLGMEISGYGHPWDDRDWFTFTVPQTGIDIFVVELSEIPGVNTYLELYDEEGNQLKKTDIEEEGEQETLVRIRMPAGQYFLLVYHNRGNNAEVPYTLLAREWDKHPASDKEIQEALRKALDYLVHEQTEQGFWTSQMHDKNAGIAGLCLMAFIGADCIAKDYSANITKTVDFIKTKYHPSSDYDSSSEEAANFGGLIGEDNPMYEHGIATLALIEALVESDDFSLEPMIQDALQLIIRSQNTEHKPKLLNGPIGPESKHYGGWRYDPDSTDSDISITGWQILALKAALNASINIPEWSLPKAAQFLRACYDQDDEAFSYIADSREFGCGQAGVGVLGLQLAGYPEDPLIPSGLKYMFDNPPVWNAEDPGDGYPFYYWYYGTRALLTVGGDDWRLWKKWMCRLLVDNQNDTGGWKGTQREKDRNIYMTALGALMLELCCGHVPMYMRERIPRPGYVEVVFEEGKERISSKNVEIILDASNSMWGQIAGEAKISIAKNVLEQIITGLPDEMNVGLRLYGHRYGLNDRRACQDTELKVPIEPIDKASLIEIIKNIQPKGKTPLVYSVLKAGNDFQNIQSGSIILITDGVESCDGDIESIAPALKELGIELKLHIVGFDIKEAEARAELEAIAKSTEGTYLDARDSQELFSSLEQTLQIEFEILDEKDQFIAKGLVGGETLRIMEGSYTLRLLVDPEPFETAITINPGQKTTLVLTKQQDEWVVKK